MKKLLQDARVYNVDMDQCQFGQASEGGEPVKKATRWMSNSKCILEEPDERCTGKGGMCSRTTSLHATCNGKTAKEAAIYPSEMCAAILKGLKRHLEESGRILPGLGVILPRSTDHVIAVSYTHLTLPTKRIV